MKVPHAAELLRRIAALPDPERFQLRDACPGDAARLAVTFDALLEFGFVERVAEGCGRWHYRLTAKGREAAETGRLTFERGYEVADRGEVPAAGTGEGRGLTPRQRLKQWRKWT